jgi:hypothetical protein
MFNWREWSGRNAELAWLRQEKKRKELCRNPAQNNTHLPTTSHKLFDNRQHQRHQPQEDICHLT